MAPTENFDDIRPYNDDEVAQAMKRIAQSPEFDVLAAYVYPDEPVDTVRRRISSYTTTAEFQRNTMYWVNRRIIADTISRFSYSGFQWLDPSTPYLYISNHRDIMLDASLLQNCLVDNGFDTSEITFGANLMMSPTIIDIGKSNKMFRVERPSDNMREFYQASRHLSEYIRHTITHKRRSVWIAQRNGRTKDGRDATDQGLIKMLCLSGPDDKAAALAELNIVPIAISYEWESCDILKALELYSARSAKYVKKPGEDLNSILTGILQPKGQVHIELCKPITAIELASASGAASGYNQAVAAIIDARVNSAYRLYPNNYIAHDTLLNSTEYATHYTAQQREAFLKRLGELKRYDGTHDLGLLTEIFLKIYSNPVDEHIG